MAKARIVADETPDGWNVSVTEGVRVLVQTVGKAVRIQVDPDDDLETPLEVSLGETKP